MNNKYRIHNFARQANIDNLALQLLSPLLRDFDYIPYTGSALRPSALVSIVNDILINNRKNIIEFGCGISTLIITKLIKSNSLSVNFYSVEEDQEWQKFMEKQLIKHDLQDYVKNFYAPIIQVEGKAKWHSLNFINDLQKIDCMIVDGPKSFSNDLKLRRGYALKALKEKLDSRYSIFLDDCHRDGELQIIKDWSNELKIPYQIYYQHLGVIFSGQFYNVYI